MYHNIRSYTVQDKTSLGSQCHQKRFHFWELDPSIETDTLVEAIWDDFTHGKRHVKITGVNRTENTISIEFEKRMCYRLGIHRLKNGIEVELLLKRDLDKRLQETKIESKRQSKWPNLQKRGRQ